MKNSRHFVHPESAADLGLAPRRLAAALTAIALVLVAVAPATAAAPEPRDFFDREGDVLPFASEDEILEFLRTAEVVGEKELSEGKTKPLRLDLERNGIRARAVFKVVDRRRERLEMRDGRSYAVFYDRSTSEVAAYRLSRLLGLDMIPPTVMREYGGRTGSLQLWVERARTETQRLEEGHRPPSPLQWLHQRALMEVFDALIANADRNTGNSLVDDRWRLWMIDHTRAFQRPRSRDDFGRVNHVTAELLTVLRGVPEQSLAEAVAPYLEQPQVDALLERRELLLEHVDRLVAERGRGAVILTDRVDVTGI